VAFFLDDRGRRLHVTPGDEVSPLLRHPAQLLDFRTEWIPSRVDHAIFVAENDDRATLHHPTDLRGDAPDLLDDTRIESHLVPREEMSEHLFTLGAVDRSNEHPNALSHQQRFDRCFGCPRSQNDRRISEDLEHLKLWQVQSEYDTHNS